MARTERHKIQNREAVADMPDWMKEKRCPHKKKYMSGKRIMPKNLTGKEKLVEMVRDLERRTPGEIRRPEWWKGYVLRPEQVEFWTNGEDRLHERVLFTREESGWVVERLFP